MKWKVEIMEVVDAPDTYTIEQVVNSVKRQFGTDVVRVERIDDAVINTNTETSDDTNTVADDDNTTTP